MTRLLPPVARAEVLRLGAAGTYPGGTVGVNRHPGLGAAGAVATWGKAVADEVDAMGFKWERKGRSSKHIPFEWSGP